MTRKAFINFLVRELDWLRQEEVIKLLLRGKYQSADQILILGMYEVFNGYVNTKKFRKIKMQEIPDEYKLLFVIYLFGNGADESLILQNKEEMIEWLEKSKKDRRLCKKIAKKLKKHFLFEFDRKVEELMKEEESM